MSLGDDEDNIYRANPHKFGRIAETMESGAETPEPGHETPVAAETEESDSATRYALLFHFFQLMKFTYCTILQRCWLSRSSFCVFFSVFRR